MFATATPAGVTIASDAFLPLALLEDRRGRPCAGPRLRPARPSCGCPLPIPTTICKMACRVLPRRWRGGGDGSLRHRARQFPAPRRRARPAAGRAPAGPLPPALAVSIYRAGCLSRALDRQSRAMQRAGQGFYTIGSSGHEGLAAVAAALRPDRHGLSALPRRRLSDRPRRTGAGPDHRRWDMLLSFASSAEDPISGGRHKVLGSAR
jgi:hypothetical protein